MSTTLSETVLDPAAREALKVRIRSLLPDARAGWGKMDVHRMVEHCVVWNEWVLGRRKLRLKQNFMGKLIGKWVLRRALRPGQPFDKGVPAGALEVKRTQGEFDAMRQRWMDLMDGYASFHNPAFMHDFFGTMSDEEIGIFVHKHMDHHLRQFGA